MKCKVCGKTLWMQVNIIVRAPATFEGNMSKKSIRKKEVEVMGVDWPRARYYCEGLCVHYRANDDSS